MRWVCWSIKICSPSISYTAVICHFLGNKQQNKAIARTRCPCTKYPMLLAATTISLLRKKIELSSLSLNLSTFSLLYLMGLLFSLFTSDPDGSSSMQSKPDLGDLPESCVASILEYFEPPEICKLAKLNRAFRGASWADFIWESKLPSNHQILIEKVLGDSIGNLGKREIYTRLCYPNSFDEGTKVGYLIFSVWLPRNFVFFFPSTALL